MEKEFQVHLNKNQGGRIVQKGKKSQIFNFFKSQEFANKLNCFFSEDEHDLEFPSDRA